MVLSLFWTEAFLAIDKIRRTFLWKRKEANGGCCFVAWEKVALPINLGGLGISQSSYYWLGMQMRWLWLQKKTLFGRRWEGLDFPVHSQVRAMFAISVVTQVGSATNNLFRCDKWLHGCSLEELAPAVVTSVPRRIVSKRTVAQALANNIWVSDI